MAYYLCRQAVYKPLNHYRKGVHTLTNTTLLNQKISESGLKQSYIQEKLGLSRQAWWRKRRGEYPLTVNEIQILCQVLNITSLREKEHIFFA